MLAGLPGAPVTFVAWPRGRLLALENLQDANVVYETFLALAAQSGQPVDTPLTHFLGFLLQCLQVRPVLLLCTRQATLTTMRVTCVALQREAAPLFKALVAAYEPSLARDEEMKLVRPEALGFPRGVLNRGVLSYSSWPVSAKYFTASNLPRPGCQR